MYMQSTNIQGWPLSHTMSSTKNTLKQRFYHRFKTMVFLERYMIANLQKRVFYHSMPSHTTLLHGTFDVLYYHHIPLHPGF
jgi:hypothetical protein